MITHRCAYTHPHMDPRDRVRGYKGGVKEERKYTWHLLWNLYPSLSHHLIFEKYKAWNIFGVSPRTYSEEWVWLKLNELHSLFVINDYLLFRVF